MPPFLIIFSPFFSSRSRIDEIEGGLYLGNMDAATDVLSLETHNITHIVTVVLHIAFIQNWALEEFWNFFNSKKLLFAFCIKLIWLGVGFFKYDWCRNRLT